MLAMRWPLLILVVCLAWTHTTWADCAAQCSTCTVHGPDADLRVNPLICSLQCEGALRTSADWVKCQTILAAFMPTLQETDRETHALLDATLEGEDAAEDQPIGLAKRYGGFMKKLEKSKAFANALMRENSAISKGGPAKKYGGFQHKFGEREAENPEPTVADSEEMADYVDSAEVGILKDERKRYGGFLRKYPKRSTEPAEGAEHLHKRYGGFMRRIRPKLKWDNEKRYGGFLRRQFKVTTRSDEDPSAFSGEIADQ
ncbi:proenkephalin-B [Ambystoma mexicanum]|uniref:proenkephalin-B n=1 Tax=Ambystoma mexicanum TaxID=8296 RepID=UPI0037E7061F